MSEEFTVTAVEYKGEKPNPHPKARGGVLHKFSVSLKNATNATETHRVYWQRKSPDLSPGLEVYGHIEQGEYGPRFKTDQRPDGGNFKAPKYEVEAGPRGGAVPQPPPAPSPQGSRMGGFQEERSRRIERQHSQEMGIRALVASINYNADPPHDDEGWKRAIKEWTDWFAEDLDADVGGGIGVSEASSSPTADVSADHRTVTTGPPLGAEEASPAQKRRLTELFNKAQIAREAQKAIVLFRCGSEKATKQGASQLIEDLMGGATHDALLAEIWDAHRAGNNPLATRATRLIPTDMPWADDGGLPEVPAKDESDIPF